MKTPAALLFIPLFSFSSSFITATAQELTRVEQVLSLTAKEAGKNPQPVRLAGTVVDASATLKLFSIHDGSHTVGVSFPAGVTFPVLGDTVEITGVTQTHTIGGFQHPRAVAHNLRLTGSRELPEARPLEVVEVNSFLHYDQWLRVEGHVVRWKFRRTDHELIIVIADGTDFTTVAVRTRGREELPPALLGAKVRVTGVNYGQNTHDAYGSMMIPSVNQLEILTPGSDDPFASPTVSLSDFAAGLAKPGARVKVSGVVLASFSQNTVYLRGGSGAQCNQLFPPWGNHLPYEEYTDAGLWPELKPGDEVEMVGTVTEASKNATLMGFSMNFCHVRVLGSQSPPAPSAATVPSIVEGSSTHDLVQVQARLLSLHQVPVDRDLWRTTMMLEAGGKKMPLTYLGTEFDSFETVQVDDELLVNAVVASENAHQPRQLRLISPGDVKSLGISPAVRTRQLWLLGGGSSVVLVLLLSWIVLLRRSHHRQNCVTAELKAANVAARESEQRWKLLFEQSPLSVQIFAPDGQTKRFNQAWKNLFCLSDEQGYAFNVLQAPDLIASGAVEPIRKAFEGEVVHVPPVPYPIPGDPPETRWIGGVPYPVTNDAGVILEVVVIHHDITESKRAAEALMEINHLLEIRVGERTAELRETQIELQRALDQERELGELKSRFVTMVSHEFRTPLGIIMSAVELLQHYSDRLPEEEKVRQLEEIRSSTMQMGGLMEQVLLLGRVEAGKLSCRPHSMDVVAFVERIVDETLSISNRKCVITLHVDDDCSAASMDQALLRHILSNLVANAVKYSPEGAEVSVNISRDGPNIAIAITDRGIGIPEKDRSRLFEAFHRCSNVGDTPGTGLGLVIVKRCVDLHGGFIGIESEIGQGTTFIVRIPCFD